MAEFATRTVLSVVTGRLLTESDNNGNGIDKLYKLLEAMTGEPPFTHQLPRFGRECKPWLLRWFPELSKANDKLNELDDLLNTIDDADDAIGKWVATLGLAKLYDVGKIPLDDHETINCYDEMVAMRGSDDGVIVLDIPE